MNAIALSGQDTISINNTVLNDLADQNCVELTFPNPIANVKVGKNGNAIFGQNQQGNVCKCKIRVIRGSDDDKFLNNLLANQQNNFSSNPLAIGEFVKRVGDGKGNVASDTYVCSSGVFEMKPGAKDNTDGDTEQSVVEYNITFASGVRVIT